MRYTTTASFFVMIFTVAILAQVKIGLNYPETGPYAAQGLDQFRAAKMALEEINASGGIGGEKV